MYWLDIKLLSVNVYQLKNILTHTIDYTVHTIQLGSFIVYSNLNTKKNLQTAVLSCVDSMTVMFLPKTAPDIAIHTETDPSASLTGKADCMNLTCTTTKSKLQVITSWCNNVVLIVVSSTNSCICSCVVICTYVPFGSGQYLHICSVRMPEKNFVYIWFTLPVTSLIITVASSCVRLTDWSVVLSLTPNVSCCSTTASFDMLTFTYTWLGEEVKLTISMVGA